MEKLKNGIYVVRGKEKPWNKSGKKEMLKTGGKGLMKYSMWIVAVGMGINAIYKHIKK